MGIYYSFISYRHDFRYIWSWSIYAWRFDILVYIRRPHFLPIFFLCKPQPLNSHITSAQPTRPSSGCLRRILSLVVWSATMSCLSLRRGMDCGFRRSARTWRWRWWPRAEIAARWSSSHLHVLSWTSWTSEPIKVMCLTWATTSTTKYISWHNLGRYRWGAVADELGIDGLLKLDDPVLEHSINISYIVSERINEMDMNELEPMILEVMDKELKAVVWFGAGLGALMGCLNILL